jgi:sugar lactone lactonase YvrE
VSDVIPHHSSCGADADNIRYDARALRVIVGYGDGALAFLNSDGKKTGEIALDVDSPAGSIRSGSNR